MTQGGDILCENQRDVGIVIMKFQKVQEGARTAAKIKGISS